MKKIRWVYDAQPDWWHQLTPTVTACGWTGPFVKGSASPYLPDDGIPCENCFRAILSRPDVGPLR